MFCRAWPLAGKEFQPSLTLLMAAILKNHTNLEPQTDLPPGKDLFGRQLHELYRFSMREIALALAVAISLAVTVWDYSAQSDLLWWLIAVAIISIGRVFVAYFYSHSVDGVAKYWANFALLESLAEGAVWGALIWFFDMNWPLHLQFALLVALTGIAVLGAWSRLSYFNAAMAFLIPAIAPMIYLLVVQGGEYFSIAILILLLTLVLSEHMRRRHKDLRASLKLQTEAAQWKEKLHIVSAELEEQQSIVRHDSELAMRVFKRLTQRRTKHVPQITSWDHMAGDFSGDLQMVSEKPGNGFVSFIGDFTGHGLPAALGAVPASLIFYSMTSKKGLDVIDIADELNRRLLEILPAEYFCCCVLVDGDLSTGRMRLFNAGMPAVLKVSSSGEINARIPPWQMPLGIAPYDVNKLQFEEVYLEPGDCLYMFSDGLSEAENREGIAFGEKHFEDVLSCPRVVDGRVEFIKSSVLTFLDGVPALDDVSLMEVAMPFDAIKKTQKPLK